MLRARGLSIVLVAVLAAPALAGCIAEDPTDPTPAEAGPAAIPAANLTQAIHGFGDFLPLDFPSFDGTSIHVDVQLPDGDGPFPVIVTYTPYIMLGGDAWGVGQETGTDTDGRGSGLAAEYVPRGYAVASAHVRGTGASGGCLTVGGEEEAKDGYELVEYLASQPWSTGRIAMMGTSYVGTTPLSTATLAPPHLTTIVSISAVSEWYRYYFENGEPRFFGELPTGVVYTDPAFWGSLGMAPSPRGAGQLAGIVGDANCFADYLAEHWAQDDYDAFWRERDYRKNVENITIPVLYAHGFLDENTPMSLVTDFWNQVPLDSKRAWFAQHGHGVPGRYEDFWNGVHRWLDHHLMERENGAMAMPPVQVEDNQGKWRVEETWPPVDAETRIFHLTAERKLVDAAPARESELSYTDPGTMFEDRDPLGFSYLSFTTDPSDAPLHLAGAPRIVLNASSSSLDTQFDAILYDVAPDGSRTFITRGYLDARHRETMESGSDLTPGTMYTFAWDMHSRDHVIDPGHVIELVLKSSDFYVVPDGSGTMNTVRFGPEGSTISLPVIDRSTRTFLDEAPFRTESPGA